MSILEILLVWPIHVRISDWVYSINVALNVGLVEVTSKNILKPHLFTWMNPAAGAHLGQTSIVAREGPASETLHMTLSNVREPEKQQPHLQHEVII